MLIDYQHDADSVLLRFKILDSSVSTGAGLTGLTFESAGLILSTIADNEAAATAYTQAAGKIETITDLGTYAVPTATKCRFREVDATNHPGLYEAQFADARYAVASSKSLLVSISGAADVAETDFVIPLRGPNPFDEATYKATGFSTHNAAAIWSAGSRALSTPSDYKANLTTLETRLSAARANLLDNIPAGTMPTQAEVLSIQNNTRTTIGIPTVAERPDADATRLKIYLNNYDTVGNMEVPDSAPTVAVVNEEGSARSGNLQHPTTHGAQTTMVNLSAGRYWIEYDLDNADSLESLAFTFSIIENGVTRTIDRVMLIVDTTAVDFTAADRTLLQDVPSTAEFEARTIFAASYFDPASDDVTTDGASRTASKATTGLSLANGSIVAATFGAGAINAAAIADAAIDNATFAADVGSTAYGSNIIALAVRKVLDAIHLDHLLAVDYDPASKPGVATALLNELVENDSGVSRYTTNALENAPAGSPPSPTAIADAVLEEVIAEHSGVAGSLAKIIDNIEGDTNELQTDWADDGRLDTILDAVSGGGAVNISTEGTNIVSTA